MNKSTFQTNMSPGFNTKMEMDPLINEVMISEKQTHIPIKKLNLKRKQWVAHIEYKSLAAMTLDLKAPS